MVDLTASPFNLDADGVRWVHDTIASLTLEEKIGQLFINLNTSFTPEYLDRIVDRLTQDIAARFATGDEDLHAMWRSVSSNGGTQVQTALLGYIDERKARADRWTQALENYPGPTTFIWGPDDPISGGHVLPRISERVPDARLIVLDGVGHYPQVEARDAVADALLA
jgi:pimeloyl-ACP methyl ester carboxylesterase